MRKGHVIPRPGVADLVFINGNIITVDGNFSIAEAVAERVDSLQENNG